MLKLARFPEQAKDSYMREEGRAGWLEVYGESEPAASSVAGTPPAKGAGLYEYHWSLGYLAPLSSHPPHGRSLLRGGRAEDDQQDSDRLADPAAHVYLYFAADSSWRVSEVLATVKHLAPMQDERTWGEELAKDNAAFGRYGIDLTQAWPADGTDPTANNLYNRQQRKWTTYPRQRGLQTGTGIVAMAKNKSLQRISL